MSKKVYIDNIKWKYTWGKGYFSDHVTYDAIQQGYYTSTVYDYPWINQWMQYSKTSWILDM